MTKPLRYIFGAIVFFIYAVLALCAGYGLMELLFGGR